MDYLYIKMFDKGLLNDRIWLVFEENPNKQLIEKLALKPDEATQGWYTTLQDISGKGVEIVSVTPYEQEQVGRKVIIKNLYILKIEDPYLPLE